MADEIVKIKIKVDSHDRQLTTLIAKMKALESQERRLASGRRLEQMGRNQARALSGMTKNWKRMFDMVDVGIKMMGKAMSGFLRFAIKGVIIEMGLLSATMIATHGVFVAGQLVMKAYRGAMQFVAGGAAGLTVALAAVAAAIREQQAAIFAYRGKGAKEFGSAMNQTRTGMRALQSDAELATLGVDALNQAYGAMSKTMNVRQIMGSKDMLKALMDFGSAGQDPAKGLTQVAEVVAILNDPKKGMSAVKSAAKKLGPEMEKAFKSGKIKTKEQFSEMLLSGELAKMAGVQGQFGAVNTTLIGMLKGYMTRIKTEFADFGDQFLEPLKVAFGEIFNIIKRDLTRIMLSVEATIGTQGYIDGFVSMIDKVSNWMVGMIRNYLPKAIGMFDRIADWFSRFKEGWNAALDYFRPLIDGARVLYKALDPIWEAIKGGVQNLFYMKDLLVDNVDNVEEFGSRIGGFITAMSDLMMNLKTMFFSILPMLNDVIAGLTGVFKLMSGLLTGLSDGGFASALAPLLGFAVLGRGLSNVKGRMMPNAVPYRTATMQVQAQSVVVSTGPAGPFASGARGGQAGYLASGGPRPVSPAKKEAKKLESPRPVSASKSGGTGPTPEQRLAMGQIIPGVPLRNQPSLTMGQTIRESASRATSGMHTRSEMLMMHPSGLFSDRAARGGYEALRQVRAVGGGIGGFFSYLGSGAYNKDTGTYNDMQTQRRILDEVYRRDTGQMYSPYDKETGTFGPATKEGSKTSTGRTGRAIARIRLALDRNRLNRNMSKFGAGTQRFQQSMGARFGTSMGLGMLSQYAPEEMRGAMALGGMIGQVNPLAGLAVAGIGGAMNAQSGTSGFLAGAGGGAAAGAMFGPAGMLIGAGIGGLTGMVLGFANKGKKELEEAKKAVANSLQKMYEGINAAADVQFRGFEQTIAGGKAIAAGTPGAYQKQAQQMINANNQLRAFLGKRTKGFTLTGQTIDNPETGELGQDIEKYFAPGRTYTAADVNKIFTQSGMKTGDEAYIQSYLAQLQFGDKDQAKSVLKELYESGGKGGLPILSAEEYKKSLKKPQESLYKYLSDAEKLNKGFAAIQKTQDARYAALEKALGKTAPEIEILANKIGVDLHDATINYQEVLAQFTASLVKTGAEVQFAMADIFVKATEPAQKKIEQQEAIATINKTTASFAADYRAKPSSKKLNQFLADMPAQLSAAHGGDQAAAYGTFQAWFGQGEKGGIFAPGMALAGLGKDVLNSPIFKEQQKIIQSGMTKLAAESIAGRVQSISNQTLDIPSLITSLGALTPEQLQRILSDLGNIEAESRPTVMEGGRLIRIPGTEQNLLQRLTGGMTSEDVFGILSGYNIKGAKLAEAPQGVNAIAEGMAELPKALSYLNITMADLKKAVEEYNETFKKIFGEGDTSTPRGGRIGDTTSSRLGQTMSRHASLDRQLTGKRTITSAFRTWGLGSPSSDHASGRAYDLTGQNLGQYAKLVHANGGFAEFHGAAANRHLHVVPGPGIGDTSTMKATVASAGGGQVTNYYNFEINGGNQSPEAIAQMVMIKIKDNERIRKERS